MDTYFSFHIDKLLDRMKTVTYLVLIENYMVLEYDSQNYFSGKK
jgi:hypothetical protein